MTAEPVLADANSVRLPGTNEVGSGGFQREFQRLVLRSPEFSSTAC